MHIQQSNISMASQHRLSRVFQQFERLEQWSGQRPAANMGSGQDRVSLSAQGQALATQSREADHSRSIDKTRDKDDDSHLDPQLRLIKQAVEAITGQKIRLINLQDLQVDAQRSESMEQVANLQQGNGQAGFGVDYQYHAEYHETESLDFSARGTVVTADGQKLEFQLDLSLQREFHLQSDTRIQLGDAVQRKDPLVINLNASAAQLTRQKYEFDLDADGKTEQVSMLQPGSGFLALDRNDDGKVNDGTELFGTRSGNGFSDLAAFDDDGNQWIDEADAIFKRLQVWFKDANGQDQLLDMQAANIGAIFLGSQQTDFRHADADNRTQGDLRSTGVFLTEDGKAGSVQQIDLAV